MSRVYVISGGPGTGKTTIINELEKRGFSVLKEAAREVGNSDKRFIGKQITEMDRKAFQDAIFQLQKKQLENLSDDIVFSDRGIGDTIVYYRFHKVNVLREIFDFGLKFKYEKVFILDFLDFYEKDDFRFEDKKEQGLIQKMIIKVYKGLGYENIMVPFMDINERVKFILDNIKK